MTIAATVILSAMVGECPEHLSLYFLMHMQTIRRKSDGCCEVYRGEEQNVRHQE